MQLPDDAEVEQLHALEVGLLRRTGNHDVVGLDIAMHESLRVQIVEPFTKGACHRDCVIDRERPRTHDLLERLTTRQLGREVQPSVWKLAGLVDGAEGGVRYTAEQVVLHLEAPGRRRATVAEDLERRLATELAILSEI